MILRTFLSKTKRLLNLGINYETNKNIDTILNTYKPSIFWKDKKIVKNQILKWKVEEIENLLKKISDIELSIKKNSLNSLHILYDFILNTSETNN